MLIWHHPVSREQTKRTVSLCWSGITLFHENRRNVLSLYVDLVAPYLTRTDEMYCLSMLVWHHPISREQTKCTVSLCWSGITLSHENRRNVLSLYVDLVSPYLTRTDETYRPSMLIWYHPISREQTKCTVSLCWSGITLSHENRRNVPSLYVGLGDIKRVCTQESSLKVQQR